MKKFVLAAIAALSLSCRRRLCRAARDQSSRPDHQWPGVQRRRGRRPISRVPSSRGYSLMKRVRGRLKTAP